MYTDKVLDHFTNPRNVGEIPDANGVGEVGNASCGDIMKIFLKVEDNVIKDVKFKTFGCGAAIATSSMVTEMAIGKTIEEALELSNAAVAEALDGLDLRYPTLPAAERDELDAANGRNDELLQGAPLPLPCDRHRREHDHRHG